MYTSLPAVKNHILLIYLSRVRVPEGALKVLILQAANCGVGAFFAFLGGDGKKGFGFCHFTEMTKLGQGRDRAAKFPAGSCSPAAYRKGEAVTSVWFGTRSGTVRGLRGKYRNPSQKLVGKMQVDPGDAVIVMS